ncbi:MAG: acyltransferase family protein [Flavipsychrobacter sp.]
MKRNYTADLIKFIASFFVICIHTKTTSAIDGFTTTSFSYITDTITHFAVPFFFAASGFFIDFERTQKLIKKSFQIILIYLLWSAIFIMIRDLNNFSYPIFYFSAHAETNNNVNILYKLLVYGYERHLWFFTAYLLGLFLVYLLRKRLGILVLLASILYLIGLSGHQWSFIYPQQVSFLNIPTSEWLRQTHLTRSGLFIGFPLMALGHIIRTRKYQLRMSQPIALILLVALFFIQYIEAVWVRTNFSDVLAESYITTIPIVIVLLLFAQKNNTIGQALQPITRLSGGIYLIHPLFMYLILILKTEVFSYSWWGYAFTPLLFLLSIVSAYLLSKNKWLSKLIFVT